MPKLPAGSKPSARATTPVGVQDDEPDIPETAAQPEPGVAPVKDLGELAVVETSTKVAPKAAARAKKAPSMETSLFTPLEEVTEYLRLLYWGREGSAKTTALATLANLGKILVINAEGGLKKRTLQARGINTDNIVVWPKPGEHITYEGLDEVYRRIKADLIDDPNSWVGVGFDSATDIVQSMVDAVSEDRVAKTERRTDTEVDIFDKFFTDRNDYGVMSKMFKDILRKYRDLQCHIVITALERRDVDEDTSKVAYGPAVSPGIQTALLGYVDIVLHTKEADEDHDYYRALTKRAGKFRTKDRLGVLPKVMVDPTAERVVAYVEEDITESTDPLQAVLIEEAKRKAELLAAKADKKPTATRARPSRAKPKPEAATPTEGEGDTSEG